MLDTFQIKEISHEGLRGSNDILRLKPDKNINTIPAFTIKPYYLNHSLRYEPDLSRFLKMLKTY